MLFLFFLIPVDPSKRPSIKEVISELKTLTQLINTTGKEDLFEEDSKLDETRTKRSSSLTSAISTTSLDSFITKCVQKVTTSAMALPKDKYVDALVQASYTPVTSNSSTESKKDQHSSKIPKGLRTGLPGFLVAVEKRSPVLKNDIAALKILRTIHVVLQRVCVCCFPLFFFCSLCYEFFFFQGAPEVLDQMDKEISSLTKVKLSWTKDAILVCIFSFSLCFFSIFPCCSLCFQLSLEKSRRQK
jgi:hypothetical protein